MVAARASWGARSACRAPAAGPAGCSGLRPVVAASFPRRRGAAGRRAAAPEPPSDVPIENLQADYCDDFVCSSSPAVERTLRVVARAIASAKWPTSRFAESVSYTGPARTFRGAARPLRVLPSTPPLSSPSRRPDGVRLTLALGPRRFEGRQGYESLQGFQQGLVEGAAGRVTSMEMRDLETADVQWVFSGKAPGGKRLEAKVTSTFKLNVITGMVEEHGERWDLGGQDPAVVAYVRAQQAAWATGQALGDIGASIDQLTGSMDDADEAPYVQDPTDPRKFFQQDDPVFKEAVFIATILAFLWLVARVFFELERL